MTMPETILELLQYGRRDDPAIAARDRAHLTHGELRHQVERTADALRARGLGPGDRIAIVLPPGPELATALLSVTSCATAAPLNPALSAQEFEFSLRDFRARAVILPEAHDGQLSAIAASLGVTVLALRPDAAGPAGRFRLEGRSTTSARGATSPRPDDVALVLHTSGTTARPKIVPLRQRHLAASAAHVASTLRLGPDDRGLNVMPLFHIHGIVACLLAPLQVGGSVFCAEGFSALRFFGDFEASRATWYSAVPSMHQAILARAARHSGRRSDDVLRFIRSSSSPLAPSVARDLESVFGAPVLEAYGMTEAAHQVASNPLPPGVRRPGSVGVAAGPEVAIMDGHGTVLPSDTPGEIVIRGPNVFDGYETPAAVTEHSFVRGWFRTGDQGTIERAGYVTITGRLKEIINRGGEKISPREVDEVLLEHAAVRQAVAFAIPHPLLGEDVGAAVVLKDEATVTERELIAFARERLTAFKVPGVLRVVTELPSGASGKIRRRDMARRLGLA